MKRLFAIMITATVTLFLFGGCSAKQNPTCRELVEIMTEAEISLPAGTVFSLAAAEGEDGYMSNSLLSSLYGNGEMPPLRECWVDGAVFLPSNAHPCELAVFLCNSHDAATDTARLLCRRLDAIRMTKGDSEYAEMIGKATVNVRGNYVIFIISSDTASAIKAINSALG